MSRRWLLVRLNGCGSSERGTETDEVRETQTVSQERVRDGESGDRVKETESLESESSRVRESGRARERERDIRVPVCARDACTCVCTSDVCFRAFPYVVCVRVRAPV